MFLSVLSDRMQLATNLEQINSHLRNTVTFLWKNNQQLKAENEILRTYLKKYMEENST
jgi:hypothetical protein